MSRVRMILVGLATAAVLTGCATSGRSTGTVIDDGSTTASVKSKLVADRPANLTQVNVDTVRGVTYLTGVVDTPEQRLRAEQLAWNTNGVRQVVNNIQVQRPPVVVNPPVTSSPSASVSSPRAAVVGTVQSVDPVRNQVTVSTGTEHLLVQLPPSVLRDIRPGDRITLDVNVNPVR
jgi:hypothetical protein